MFVYKVLEGAKRFVELFKEDTEDLLKNPSRIAQEKIELYTRPKPTYESLRGYQIHYMYSKTRVPKFYKGKSTRFINRTFGPKELGQKFVELVQQVI